jgi:hypothetical protein
MEMASVSPERQFEEVTMETGSDDEQCHISRGCEDTIHTKICNWNISVQV